MGIVETVTGCIVMAIITMLCVLGMFTIVFCFLRSIKEDMETEIEGENNETSDRV